MAPGIVRKTAPLTIGQLMRLAPGMGPCARRAYAQLSVRQIARGVGSIVGNQEPCVKLTARFSFLGTGVVFAPASGPLGPRPRGRRIAACISARLVPQRRDTKLAAPPIVPQLSASGTSGYSWRDPVDLRMMIYPHSHRRTVRDHRQSCLRLFFSEIGGTSQKRKTRSTV